MCLRHRLSYFTVEFIFVTDVYFLTVLVLTSSYVNGQISGSNPEVTSLYSNNLYSNINKSCLVPHPHQLWENYAWKVNKMAHRCQWKCALSRNAVLGPHKLNIDSLK